MDGGEGSEGTRDLGIVAGIDEAGFGPVLGPMVVSAVEFWVPDELSEVSMWGLLGGTVTKKRPRRGVRIAINDSKKLYSGLRGRDGLKHLERGVLGMLHTRGARVESLRQLLGYLCPHIIEQLSHYPWYNQRDVRLPHSISRTELTLLGNALTTRMKQVPIELRSVRCEPLLVKEYNRLVAATRNKSSVLLDVTCRLLMHLWRRDSHGNLRVYVDRQGGRTRYLPALQRVFPGCQFKVLDESDHLSAYRITDAGRCAEIYFARSAEQQYLPAALGSMFSKYLRELFMILFNRFWGEYVPDIAPTGGYYVDGRRFYGEIKPVMRELGLSEEIVYRCR